MFEINVIKDKIDFGAFLPFYVMVLFLPASKANNFIITLFIGIFISFCFFDVSSNDTHYSYLYLII